MKLVLKKIVDEYTDGSSLGQLTLEGDDRWFDPETVEAVAELLGIEYEVVPFVPGATCKCGQWPLKEYGPECPSCLADAEAGRV